MDETQAHDEIADSPAAAGPSTDDPGSGGRLLLGWVLIGASAVMLTAGWYGVSGQPVVAAQIAYLVSGGLGGLMTGIAGVGLLVSHDVRRDRERLGRVEAAMLEIREMLLEQAQALEAARSEMPAAAAEGNGTATTARTGGRRRPS